LELNFIANCRLNIINTAAPSKTKEIIKKIPRNEKYANSFLEAFRNHIKIARNKKKKCKIASTSLDIIISYWLWI